jgi:GTPase
VPDTVPQMMIDVRRHRVGGAAGETGSSRNRDLGVVVAGAASPPHDAPALGQGGRRAGRRPLVAARPPGYGAPLPRSTVSEPPKAVLVGVQTPDQTSAALASSLEELRRLCDTLGVATIARVTQRRDGRGSKNLLGAGKLAELAAWTGGPGVVHRGPAKKGRDDEESDDEDDLPATGAPLPDDEAPFEPPTDRATMVVVDAELSPSQLRNLQKAAGCEVLDRTGVILEIFHRHAKSREARLQVEIARLIYQAPRLRESDGASERQRGGIGGKGAGESDLELDRRRVRDRIAELRRALVDIEAERGARRARRRAGRQVALVGYTNAGKSSLMRAITGSEPYVADKLFATLDTTVRRLHPEVVPPILVTDTVGFIRDLPHDLVASFRSTLEAALDATLLLHVVDAADADKERQLAVTAEVLAHIEADDIPRQLVLNKCDKLDPQALAALREAWPDAWLTSAKDPAQTADLHARIVARFAEGDEETDLFVPWDRGAIVGVIRSTVNVLDERFDDDGTRYRVSGSPAAIARLRDALA